MEQNSKMDELTGLFGFDRFLEDMKQCRQFGCYGYLLILGIDNFKNINMKYGRKFGDEVLMHVADSIRGDGSTERHVYRLDGDRFAVMFPGGSRDIVEHTYEDIRGDLKEYCTISGGSVGCDPNCGVDCGTIYQYAEHAMDLAKESGKNTLLFFSTESYQKKLKSISIQDEIRRSVRHGMEGFCLNYQPLVNSRSFGIWGAEALLRYESADRGRLSPVEFIPILEETELIVEVGEWVLRTAAAQCREWREKIPDFHMNVNLSYVQLCSENFGERVLEILEESGLPGEALTLEVTENMKLDDYEFFNELFRRWREKGITVSIDDFGTGYSNLGYLKSLHVDEVKIDRCFVDQVQDSVYNYRLLESMIEIAHSAGARVCCEGIETEEELKVLRELTAELFQGYLFTVPLNREELEKLYFRTDSPEYRERAEREEKLRALTADSGVRIENPFSREEFGIIVDELEAIISVSDMDTCEIYYLNAFGRKILGFSNYKGRKCHEVLQGKSEPCLKCARSKTGMKKFHTWEVYNERLQCRLKIKDKVVPWQGKTARLSIAQKVGKTD